MNFNIKLIEEESDKKHQMRRCLLTGLLYIELRISSPKVMNFIKNLKTKNLN